MPIPERTLAAWSALGSANPSQDTLREIESAFYWGTAEAVPFTQIEVQGSYRNGTFVAGFESDIDILLMTMEETVSYEDQSKRLVSVRRSSKMTREQLREMRAYFDYKAETCFYLQSRYGNRVRLGKRVIHLEGERMQARADILPCFRHRAFITSPEGSSRNSISGISFFLDDGTQIINYPDLHWRNGTQKQSNTQMYYKPMIRLLKNMRNLAGPNPGPEAGAPSYYIECLLYNVPDHLFGDSLSSTFLNTVTWLSRAKYKDFVCVNEQAKLFHPDRMGFWRVKACQEFLKEVLDIWESWR